MTTRWWNLVGAPLVRALDPEVVAWLSPDEPPLAELASGGVRRVHLLADHVGSADAGPETVLHDGGFDPTLETERLDLAVLGAGSDPDVLMAGVRAVTAAPARPVILLGGIGSASNGGAGIRSEVRRFCAGASQSWELLHVPGEDAAILAPLDALGERSNGVRAALDELVTPSFARRRIAELESENAASAEELRRLRSRVDELRRQTERADGMALGSERRAAELSVALDEAVRGQAALLERVAELSARIEAADAEVESRRRAAGELEARLHRADQRLEEWDRSRRELLARLQRVADSRAWRWGHGLSRLLRRLAFRGPGHTDGVRDAVRQVEAMPLDRRRR